MEQTAILPVSATPLHVVAAQAVTYLRVLTSQDFSSLTVLPHNCLWEEQGLKDDVDQSFFLEEMLEWF